MYVPDFLDPDAFEGIIFYAPHAFQVDRPLKCYEKAYWKAERRRTLLRLVCKPWSDYCNLPRFQHRFVRMEDIWHNKIRETSLKTAIRVNFRFHECSCTERCLTASQGGSLALLRQRYNEFCLQVIASVGPMRMEIADFSSIDVDDLAGSVALQNMKKVKTLLTSVSSYKNIAILSREMQDLTHFHTYSSGFQGPLVSLRSSGLVSLHFNTRGVVEYKEIVWHLPSLRYLGIVYDGHFCSSTFLYDFLLPVLRVVGSRLRSLYVSTGPVDYKIPSDIWNMCPVLERIHASADMEAPPPDFHPLHTACIPLSDFDVLSILNMDTSIFTWPNLRRVIINTSWHLIENGSHGFWRWLLEWTRLGITLEDRYGHTLEDFKRSFRKD